MKDAPADAQTTPPRRLRLQRGLARAAILWERLWPATAPLLGVLGLFGVAALSGLLPLLPGWLHVLLLALFGAAAAAALLWAVTQVRVPASAEGERRLERASGLAHRPLTSLADRPATNAADPSTAALWAAHQARAAKAASRLKVGAPHPGLARRDPIALRAAIGLSLLASLVVAGPEAGQRLAAALSPALGAAKPPPLPVQLEVWITPPPYTGLPPVFLRHAADGPDEITVPAGSALTANLSGGAGGPPSLDAGAGPLPFKALDPQSFAVEATLSVPGRLAVVRDGREIASWGLRLLSDAPPSIAFTSRPGPAPGGTQLRLEYEARDDYGVASVEARLRLVARPEAPPLALPLPVPGGASRTVRGAGQPDLTAHPWAGLPVTLELEAKDGAGQTGRSETVTVELPERRFEHPVARELIALRKRLTLAPAERSAHIRDLDRITAAPESFDDDLTVFLGLRSARARLRFDRRDEAIEEVQETLWSLALHLEEGGRDRTWRHLSELRRELREAIERAERGEPVERRELERLAEQLREAMERYMQALVEAMRRDGVETLPFDRSMRTMDLRDLQRMAERLQEAARQGDLDRMRQQLADLERAIEQLQRGRAARGESPERQQQRQQGQQMMGAVNDMLQRQGQLMDRSHERAEQERQSRGQPQGRPQGQQQGQTQGRQQGQPQGQPQGQQPGRQQGRQQGQQPGQAGDAQRDARQQQALRRSLGELMEQFGEFTGEVPEPLGRADQAMREAIEALRRGDNQSAQSAQQRAMEALQQGGREMQNQMAGRMGLMQPDDADGDPGGENTEIGRDESGEGRQLGQGRDPLGRPRRDGVGGRDEGSDVRVPEEMELQRTRDIQEELRRRAGERGRPQPELDYIDRLLRRF
ncbi:MAG: TIGR02302 family protein [Acetobacteraceae bacterium]